MKGVDFAHGLHYCARIPVGVFSSVCAPLLNSSLDDMTFEYLPSASARAQCNKLALPIHPIKVRLLKIVLPDGETEILATNVLDQLLTVDSFKSLYHLRWQVEEKYKQLKSRIEMEDFSGKFLEFIRQDFHANILRLNINTMLAHNAKCSSNALKPRKKYLHAPNMAAMLSKLRPFIITTFCFHDTPLFPLIQFLNDAALKFSSPIRPGRS